MSTLGGIEENFVTNYKATIASNKKGDVTGYIRLGGTDKSLQADIEVIIVMKTLLSMGVTNNEALAIACRNLFLSMLKAHNEYITRNRVLAVLKPSDYEEERLCAAIKRCLSA